MLRERSKQSDAGGETERRKGSRCAEIDPRGEAMRVSLLGLADELTQRSRDIKQAVAREPHHDGQGNQPHQVSSGMIANPTR